MFKMSSLPLAAAFSLGVFVVVTPLGCAAGGAEPDTQPDPVAEPDNEPDYSGLPIGTLTVKVFDDATDTLLCDKTTFTSEAQRDTNFAFTYVYLGESAGEIFSFIGGHEVQNTTDADQDFVAFQFSGKKASSGVHDVPPAKAHAWNETGLLDWGGIVFCGNSNVDEANFVIGLDDEDLNSVTSLSAAVTAYVADDVAAGWSPAPLCPAGGEAAACEVQLGRTSISLSLVGTGKNAGGTDLLRVEVEAAVTHVESTFARDESIQAK